MADSHHLKRDRLQLNIMKKFSLSGHLDSQNGAQREGESPSLPAWKTWLDKSQAAWSECGVNSALSGWTRNTLKFLLATETVCSAEISC